ncbi:MAG: tRNA pseudouridine(38-40) synthase TruA [Fimbriimonadaceae bacterium]|nr:tRNA pseudouridine(38-40) synthase TruA [Fimbriimonadaceae bacterium]
MRIAATVAYDGTHFAGFQRQADARTVQEELESALAWLYAQRITVHGAGRTDAGVHARGQVIAFDAPATLPAERLALAIRQPLPADVAVRAAWAAAPEFDPRRHASRRVYRYSVVEDLLPDPLRDRFVTRVPPGLDWAALQAASGQLVGEHDFGSLCCHNGQQGSTRRTVRRVTWDRREDIWTAEIEGDSFLYRQVRCMMGALLAIGRGRYGADLLASLLAGAPWPAGVAVAPPTGLVLERVEYGPRARWV